MEGVQQLDELSVQQPSCSSNAISTDCNQFTCEPSTSFLMKLPTQKVHIIIIIKNIIIISIYYNNISCWF